MQGLLRRWTNCHQVGGHLWDLVAIPNRGAYTIHLQVGFADTEDALAADTILESFVVRGNLLS